MDKNSLLQLILNNEGRLEQFKSLFEFFEKKGLGKLTTSHFVIETSVRLQPRNPTEYLFTAIQDNAAKKGITHNIFCFSIVL